MILAFAFGILSGVLLTIGAWCLLFPDPDPADLDDLDEMPDGSVIPFPKRP